MRPARRQQEVRVHKLTTVIVLLILGALPAGTAGAGEPTFTEGAIHIGAVMDLDASLAFYTDVIGSTSP